MPSKLDQMQLQFRQRLMQEKEEKMIKIHNDNQQKALSKISKYTTPTTMSSSNHYVTQTSTITVPKPQTNQAHHSPIKKGSPGVDRSRPLPPIAKERSNLTSKSLATSTNDYTLKANGIYTNNTTPRNNFDDKSTSNSSVINNNIANKSNGNVSAGIMGNFVNKLNGNLSNATGSFTNKFNGNTSSPSSSSTFSSNSSSNRSSPVSPGNDTRTKMSRSADQQGSTRAVGMLNGRSASTKNTLQKQESLRERKNDQELNAKLKQAELQRLRSNSKVREDPTARNGFSSSSHKPEIDQKKFAKPSVGSTRTKSQPLMKQAKKPSFQSASSSSENRKPPGPGQAQCSICFRNFNDDRIEKHRTICQKTKQKKVKVFDATKMRTKGTEAESFVKKGIVKSEVKPKKSDWRKKHSDFIEAIRQAKVVQQHLAKGGKVSDLPPPPPSDTSDYVPCPHCGRKFNESVAERHIPKCKNILSNKKNPNVTNTRRK